MIIESVVVGPLLVNCYVLGCESSREGVVLDPGHDVERILSVVSRHGLKVVSVINTHGHFDHTGGNKKIVNETGAGLLIHELDAPMLTRAVDTAAMFGLTAENSPPPTRFLTESEFIPFGKFRLQVLHTPGHTPGGCSLFIDGMVFTGDTLFSDSVGRTDFPGGSSVALGKSIREKLLVLPDDTLVYPGHGPSTTIGRERRHNPYLTPSGVM
ncbi:MAG: MBL fold metallo-hydrolase [Geobacteraceae bacterium]|nr:MBL fold metallo-hydrolase [Geobacteraceae bacterium]